jgi:hypothetical protein
VNTASRSFTSASGVGPVRLHRISLRCYTTQHPLSCGLDRHARTLSLGILDPCGEVLGPRHLPTDPEAFLHTIAPDREGLVVAVAGLFTWDGRAARGAAAGLPWVLGQALSRPALQGGKATHAQSDSPKMAARRRGGRLPPASGSPAPRRAPRALRRRRRPLTPTRAALLAPVQHPQSPSHPPAIGPKSAAQAPRVGGAEHCADPAGPHRSAGDLALLTADAALRRAVARPSVPTARPHDAQTRSRRPTVPGLGTILSLGLRDALHALHRFPRVQALRSSGHLVHWAQAATGKRVGTAGAQSGQAHRPWAWSAAAVVGRRDPAVAPTSLARLVPQPAQGNAWTSWAQPWARAVSARLQRQGAGERDQLCHPSGRAFCSRFFESGHDAHIFTLMPVLVAPTA